MDIAVLMDELESIKPYKDTTFALMLAAQALGHRVMVFGQRDWQVRDGAVQAYVRTVQLYDQDEDYFRVLNEEVIDLGEVDVLLQRKDPPFNLRYVYDSYMLDLLEAQGVRVVNPPQALRNMNEKFAITRLPQCTPETLITKSRGEILAFRRGGGETAGRHGRQRRLQADPGRQEYQRDFGRDEPGRPANTDGAALSGQGERGRQAHSRHQRRGG